MSKDAEIIIDSLIQSVMERYPQERLNEIKERSNNIWNGKPAKDRLTWAYAEGFDRKAPEIPLYVDENQRDLIHELQLILNRSDWNNDYYPGITSGLRQVAIPSYFGCVDEITNSTTRVKIIIKDPSDVYSMPEPGFVKGSVGGDILAKMKYFHERVKGQISVYMTDVQGPFSEAAQMWGIEDFLVAVYEYPEEAHYLLQKSTDAIIKYFHLMYEAVEGDLIPIHCQPIFWMPKTKGVAVSDDFAAIVSPSVFREFSKPYLEQIAKEFGGVVIHSCGSLNHMTEELLTLEGLTGLNFSASETNLADVKQALKRLGSGKNITVITHNSWLASQGLKLLNAEEHIEQCKEYNADGFCIVFPIEGYLPEIEGVHWANMVKY